MGGAYSSRSGRLRGETVRAFFDRIYIGAAYLAGAFLIGTLLAVLIGIFGRLLQFHTPGLDAYAGYSMAASSFLALAHTLRRGEHIRVTLVLQHLRPARGRVLDAMCYFIAILVSAALAWFSIRLAWQSHLFHDISTGLDATPLWIPQIGMVIGTSLLFCSFVQGLIELLTRSGPTEAAKATDALAVHGE